REHRRGRTRDPHSAELRAGSPLRSECRHTSPSSRACRGISCCSKPGLWQGTSSRESERFLHFGRNDDRGWLGWRTPHRHPELAEGSLVARNPASGNEHRRGRTRDSSTSVGMTIGGGGDGEWSGRDDEHPSVIPSLPRDLLLPETRPLAGSSVAGEQEIPPLRSG